MFAALPDWIDPARLATQGREITGSLPLGDMPRLAAELTETSGQATARFQFLRAPGRGDQVRGEVQATLRLRCERCLQAMDVPVDHHFEALLISDEAALESQGDDVDVVWVEPEGLSLHRLLEEELLLALPVVALHDEGTECARFQHHEFAPSDIAQTRREEDNPFAVLKGLKTEDNDNH